MSIRKPIFVNGWAIDPNSITALTPSPLNALQLSVFISGVDVNGYGSGLTLYNNDSAEVLLILYPYEYQRGYLPQWMANIINQLKEEEITKFLRERGTLLNDPDLDLEAEARKLSEDETEPEFNLEMTEEEIKEYEEDSKTNLDDLPY